jgi:putative nucleotidyltransferase with HDIG domain
MQEKLVKQRNVVLIPELKSMPDILRSIPVSNPRALFIFPLTAADTVVGLALFIGCRPGTLPEDDLEKITTISREVAGCIENATRYLKLKQNYLGLVTALVKAIEEKNFCYKGNSEVVAELAARVAQKMKISSDDIELIRIAALLHDIGKIAISEQILLKKEALTSEELIKLKMHSIVSTGIVRRIDGDNKLAPIVLFHHERYDGSGYPEGLRGEAIPLGARILSVCDAYAAMTTSRPYRHERSSQEAIQELRRCAGTQFDPGVVKVFLQLLGFEL